MRNSAKPRLTLLDEAEIDHLAQRAQKLIDNRKRALETRFGWTYFKVQASLSPEVRRVTLNGTVILRRLGRQLTDEVRAIFPGEWAVVNQLQPVQGGLWHRLLPGITRLESSHPSPRSFALTTELAQRDGPVQFLASTPQGRLVRALDGTVGWTKRSFGLITRPPSSQPIRPDLSALMRIAKSYKRVPYRFGGATRSGIDCSGLIQRSLRDAFNAIVPRHSLDQIRAAGRPSRDFGHPGDAVYTWSHGQKSWHVGLIVAPEKRRRRTIVHASTSRGCVIEEPLDHFIGRADCVRHVQVDQFLDGYSCLAGI